MKVGVLLPSFSERAAPAIEAARQADAAGLHGVFAYDHLWPMGLPGRPAICPFPLLGAVAALTTTCSLGTLVARVGLGPPSLLLSELVTLDAVSGGRFVAGVGTGDKKSRDENLAWGLPYPTGAERRALLDVVVVGLVAAGVATWVGGNGGETRAVARQLGATVNLWGATPGEVATEAARGPVTWGGRWPGGAPAAAALLGELATAGAGWAIFTWPGSVAVVVEAVLQAGLALSPAAGSPAVPAAARAPSSAA